jgi:hypothetical protein
LVGCASVRGSVPSKREDQLVPLKESALAVLGGALGVLVGLAFRLGRGRSAARWYFDEESPWYIRNLIFGTLPFGGFFLFGWAAAMLLQDGTLWVGWAVLSAGLVCALVAVLFMYRPPDMMKPRWLRDEEERRGVPVRGPEHRGGVWMVIDRFGLIMMLVLGGGALLASVLMVAVEVAR